VNITAGGQALYLLTGTLGAFACYQGVRSVLAFRTARTPRDVDEANLRALAAIAFASLGSGAALRYLGILLFVVLAFAFARFGWAGRGRGDRAVSMPEPAPGARPPAGDSGAG
jgi:hypothetical protein